MTSEPYVALPEWEYPPVGEPTGSKLNPQERIQLTLVVRSACSTEVRRARIEAMALELPAKRHYPSPQEFQHEYGSASKDLQATAKWAESYGCRNIETSQERRWVTLSGTLSEIERMLHIQFVECRDRRERLFRGYQGQVEIPASLAAVVEGFTGLTTRERVSHIGAAAPQLGVPYVDAREVAHYYNFPRCTSKQQCVAVILLGGGFYEVDLKGHFAQLGLPVPQVTVVNVGARNDPAPVEPFRKIWESQDFAHATDQQIWTAEATSDIELIGSFAPEAHIVAYFAPNTASGKYRAFVELLNDTRNPTVVSCSWGAYEETLPQGYFRAMDVNFELAAIRGITVCVSSGDKGDGLDKNGRPRVQFPSSSPHSLSCGGTSLRLAGPQTTETSWSEKFSSSQLSSGHGVSRVFHRPNWQSDIGLKDDPERKHRIVPDVAGKADIATGYGCLTCGIQLPAGGTSAAAPMWAGLITLMNEQLQTRTGLVTPLLYQNAFREATKPVTNSHRPRWDPLTGLGRPDGMALLAALRGK